MTNLFVRNLDPATKDFMERASRARGITYAEYLKRLVELHEMSMERGEAYGNGAMLRAAGLEPVRA